LAGLYGYGHFIYVPAGYVSGTQLSDTDTFNGATFASLGITSGTYTYTWGSGPTADTATVMTIASVPEPSTWAAILGGFGILGAVQRFRRQRGS
jgi:hypothetical protein